MRIRELEEQVEELIKVCTDLESRHARLLEAQQAWKLERSQLMEKNNQFRTRLENMIIHLKNLEQA